MGALTEVGALEHAWSKAHDLSFIVMGRLFFLRENYRPTAAF
jgi:hypothetical protein